MMAVRRRAQKAQDVTVSDVLGLMAKEVAKQARKPNVLGYVPHQKQSAFHAMQCRWRLYIGGNRSGKTYGSVVEDIWWASGTHPHIDIKGLWPSEQIRGRVVAVNFEEGVKQIIVPLFKSLCPPTYLRGDSWEKAWQPKGNGGILWFKYNDSFIEFMSYEQAVEKFAGTSRHFIHYDEEPPKSIYNECQARLIDTNGRSWISMTPVEGMTWVYEDIYEPGESADDREIIIPESPGVGPVWLSEARRLGVVEVDMGENPHLSRQAIIDYLINLDEDERVARQRGKFVQMAGKVFKVFTVETHVTSKDIDPKALQQQGWQIYTSTDHGWNAPTAWLWHAVAPEPDGQVITFAEHYKSEMTIEEHSAIVRSMEDGWNLNRDDIIRTGDPAMHQHSGITGTTVVQEYGKCGLYIYTDSIPTDRGIGIARMQEYFRLRGDGKPKWMISDACPNFIKELKNLRFRVNSSKKLRDQNNPQEQVHKKDDHAFDSAKYFATFLGELAPDPVERTSSEGPSATMSYDEALRRSREAAVDQGPKWEIVETYH